jgi:hypothetical protein
VVVGVAGAGSGQGDALGQLGFGQVRDLGETELEQVARRILADGEPGDLRHPPRLSGMPQQIELHRVTRAGIGQALLQREHAQVVDLTRRIELGTTPGCHDPQRHGHQARERHAPAERVH